GGKPKNPSYKHVIAAAYGAVMAYIPSQIAFGGYKKLRQIGAAAVNLVAGEKPADVYSGIAAR
ncbi:hypothetical protein A2U01_0012232, partial [Trifolium medium]|nr:hypothetical protein [Trifolium medium]